MSDSVRPSALYELTYDLGTVAAGIGLRSVELAVKEFGRRDARAATLGIGTGVAMAMMHAVRYPEESAQYLEPINKEAMDAPLEAFHLYVQAVLKERAAARQSTQS